MQNSRARPETSARECLPLKQGPVATASSRILLELWGSVFLGRRSCLLGRRSWGHVRGMPPSPRGSKCVVGGSHSSPTDKPLGEAVECGLGSGGRGRPALRGCGVAGLPSGSSLTDEVKGQPPELDATFLGKRGDLGGPSAVPSKAARAVAPVGAEPVPDDGRDGRSHQAVLPSAACGTSLGSHNDVRREVLSRRRRQGTGCRLPFPPQTRL